MVQLEERLETEQETERSGGEVKVVFRLDLEKKLWKVGKDACVVVTWLWRLRRSLWRKAGEGLRHRSRLDEEEKWVRSREEELLRRYWEACCQSQQAPQEGQHRWEESHGRRKKRNQRGTEERN